MAPRVATGDIEVVGAISDLETARWSCCRSPDQDCDSRPNALSDSGMRSRRATASQIASRRSSCAFSATITVLADMKMAATAGASRMPQVARTPAASGMATML
jgi:hypothetical protein